MHTLYTLLPFGTTAQWHFIDNVCTASHQQLLGQKVTYSLLTVDSQHDTNDDTIKSHIVFPLCNYYDPPHKQHHNLIKNQAKFSGLIPKRGLSYTIDFGINLQIRHNNYYYA